MDTPGLNDVGIPLSQWLEKYKTAIKQDSSVSLVVLVMLAKSRPDIGDKGTTAIVFECFKAITA